MLNYLLGTLTAVACLYAGYIAGQKSIKQEPLELPKLPSKRAPGKVVRMTPEREAALKEQE